MLILAMPRFIAACTVLRLDPRPAVQDQWNTGRLVDLVQPFQVQAGLDLLVILTPGGNCPVDVADGHREPVAAGLAIQNGALRPGP